MDMANTDGLRPSPFLDRVRNFKKELRPRPNSGFLYKDIIYILMIGFIQNTLIRSISIPGFTIDLITPWLVITAIHQRALPANILSFTASLILEMRTSVPAGLYMVIYMIATNIIIQVRPALSWRHQIPWFVTYLVAALWVHIFEVFVVFMSRGVESITVIFMAQQVLKVITAVGFGLVICQKWLKFDAEEPVPK